jgi:Gpi18-like mannosyltransferase
MITQRNDQLYFRVLFIGGILLAFWLRYLLLPYVSGDMGGHFFKWYDEIKQNGFSAYGRAFSSYTPSYLYVMGMSTILPIDKLYAIKGISVIFDFIASIFIYKFVRLHYPKSAIIPWTACLVFLFTPTVVLNSSCWGQSDIIYTTFILTSLYSIARATDNKGILLGIFLFAVAYTFKGLSLFLLPLYIVICRQRNVSLWYLSLIPLIYIVTIIPSWLAGRKFWDLLTIISVQINWFPWRSYNAPTFYLMMPPWRHWVAAGSILGLVVAAVLMKLSSDYLKRSKWNEETIIKMALCFSLIIPFFLPRMHERYFFLADIFSIIYAFYFPKYFYIPIVIVASSLLSYLPFLFGIRVAALGYVALALFAIIIILLYDLRAKIKEPAPS